MLLFLRDINVHRQMSHLCCCLVCIPTSSSKTFQDVEVCHINFQVAAVHQVYCNKKKKKQIVRTREKHSFTIYKRTASTVFQESLCTKSLLNVLQY